MKKTTCNHLGGACDLELTGETFEEVAQKAQEHGAEMAAVQDPAHLQAMEKMRELMQNPEAMQSWMSQKKAEFEALPEEA